LSGGRRIVQRRADQSGAVTVLFPNVIVLPALGVAAIGGSCAAAFREMRQYGP
jgi:hypothetical protein